MPSGKSPNRPVRTSPFVDRTGNLTEIGFQTLDQIWQQVAAGFVVTSCNATGKNAITLTPRLHREGSKALANYMPFAFVAEDTSDAAVTAQIGNSGLLKVYKDAGAAQAGSGDVVSGSLYIVLFNDALDGGAGGWVLK